VALAALAEKLCAEKPGVTLRFCGCMRQCGKGPNLKWDGQVHNRADEAMLKKLLENE
jgi:NADH:ubiquinone oxidoreductase subunit E